VYDTLLSDCRDRGSKLLCELAQIPEACAEQFRDEVGKLLSQTLAGDGINIRKNKNIPSETVAAIEKFEGAVRQAHSLFFSVPEYWRCLFQFFEPQVVPGEEPWDSIFRRMISNCAEHTGGRPIAAAKRGRGRRRGGATKDTYPLRNFVWKLARVVRRHGGGLTLYAKEQRGTWIDALNGLQPLFFDGFIPAVLPLSMIEEVQAKANKLPL